MLIPGLYAGHGYRLISASEAYTHRELCDLLGNQFAASSVMVSCLALFSMASAVSRQEAVSTMFSAADEPPSDESNIVRCHGC